MASTYYTGRVHSILGKNLNAARRRRFGQFFSPYYTLRKFWIFGRKSVNFFLIFFWKSIPDSPVIPSVTFRPIRAPDHRQKRVPSWPRNLDFFNNMLPSIFRQVRRQEQAILASTYYAGRVHSILVRNFNVARRRRFGEFFSPYYTLRKFWIFGRKSRSIFFGFFSRNLY